MCVWSLYFGLIIIDVNIIILLIISNNNNSFIIIKREIPFHFFFCKTNELWTKWFSNSILYFFCFVLLLSLPFIWQSRLPVKVYVCCCWLLWILLQITRLFFFLSLQIPNNLNITKVVCRYVWNEIWKRKL